MSGKTMMPLRPGRRHFLALCGILGGALAAVCYGTRAFGRETSCSPTGSDAKGPFFIEGRPVLTDLNRWGKPGEPMLVTGRVLDADDMASPVQGARLEVWQTDGNGLYHPQDNGSASDFDDRGLDMRGTILAGDDGSFSYRTVVPGRYPPRPRHIHYRISAPGYRTLITQHYPVDGEDKADAACRSATIDRSGGQARFDSPDVYLRRV